MLRISHTNRNISRDENMNKKSVLFVMIHGSWQSSFGWQEVSNLLILKGHSTLLIDLPGHGHNFTTNFTDIHLKTYVDYVTNKISHVQANHDIILVGHSMSGMVVSQVAELLDIKLLIYVAAFLPINGECLLDIAKRSNIDGVSKNMVINNELKSISLATKGLENIFYNDCDKSIVDLALAKIQDEPLQPFCEMVNLTNERFGCTPKVYIECTKDNAISIELQKMMCARWVCTVDSLTSGHAPFYSMPEELSEALAKHTN